MAVPAAPALVILLLLALVLTGGEPEDSLAAASTAAEAPDGRVPAYPRPAVLPATGATEAATAQKAKPVEDDLPVKQVRIRVVSMDEARQAAGLPLVMTELGRAESYRAPTPAEQVDPLMGAVYRLDRKLHEEKWLARHNDHEASRFLADAERASDPEEKALLERSATEHKRRARAHEVKMRKLRAERALLVGQTQGKQGGQP